MQRLRGSLYRDLLGFVMVLMIKIVLREMLKIVFREIVLNCVKSGVKNIRNCLGFGGQNLHKMVQNKNVSSRELWKIKGKMGLIFWKSAIFERRGSESAEKRVVK